MKNGQKRLSIVDDIYVRLRERILTGEFADGEQLRQLDIAEAMGCSQGPVRHALDRLSNENLVLLLPNRGYFVAQISLEHARQAYSLRALIEPFAAVETFRRMTDRRLEEFNAQFARMQAANRRPDFKASLAADMRFHRLFYEDSGFPLLVKFWDQMEMQIRKFVTVTTPIYVSELPRVTELHLPILNALKHRDASALAKATKDHVEHVWRLVESGGDSSASGTTVSRGLTAPRRGRSAKAI